MNADPGSLNGAPPSEYEWNGMEVSRQPVNVPPELISRKTRASALDTIADETPPPLLLDRIDPDGHTILFGAGGIGKGTLVSAWVVGLVNAEHRVLIVDYENHPGEWRRRVGALGGNDVLPHVHHLVPTAALWDAFDDIAAEVVATGATVLIIDSIVVACAGHDVVDPSTVGLYAGAVARLGLPVLSLGHNTKAGDTLYPFGSVFWHNLARLTWSLSREAAGVVLACRKSNDYQKPHKRMVRVDWRDDRPVEVTETPYAEAIIDLALAVLTDEPMRLQSVVDAINDDRDEDEPPVKKNSVRKALKRARDLDQCRHRNGGYVRWLYFPYVCEQPRWTSAGESS